MQNRRIEVFFTLLRAGLWGCNNDDLDLNKGVGWNEMYQLAQEQSVQGLLLQGIEELKAKGIELSVPKVLLLQWIGEVQIIEQRNMDMNAFVADLIEKLQKNEIYALLVKGQGVAQCYEKPLWRSCGDVDLFLSDENYKKAKDYLITFASSVEKEAGATQHLGMTIDGWVVELHGKLNGNLSSRVKNLLEGIKRETFYGGQVRSWINDDTPIFLMKEENEILYGFIHFLNHFYKEGVGLRQICDWCRLMWTYRESLNYELLGSRIKRAGLVSEWKAFYNLASRYLGMPDLNSSFMFYDSRFDKKADRIMEFMLKSGNMGHNRDMSHFRKYPYFIRKCVSMGRRIGDLINHARIFPMDSLRFFPRIMFNGVRSAIKGE